jgi:S1-C subfamily serine protease/antitoxin component YwqK of YwqJK toxin-antitoxin module
MAHQLKNVLIFLILFGFCVNIQAQIIEPNVQSQDYADCKIIKIDLGGDATTVHFKWQPELEYNSEAFICIDSSIHITVPGVKEIFKMLKTNSIPLCPSSKLSANTATTFSIKFDPLPNGIRLFHIVEVENGFGFNFESINTSLVQSFKDEFFQTTQELKMRTKPDRNSLTIFTIPKGQKLVVISKSGSYLKVKYKGRKGFIQYAEDNTSGGQMIKEDKYIITNTSVKMYRISDKTSNVIYKIPADKRIKVIGSLDNFYKVYYSNRRGYISKNSISTDVDVPEKRTQISKITIDKATSMYKEADKYSRKIFTIKKGTSLTVLETKGEYVKVRYQSRQGYIHIIDTAGQLAESKDVVAGKSVKAGLYQRSPGKELVYFDHAWNPTKKSKANFYRELTFGKDGQHDLKVNDFYITSELQWTGTTTTLDDYSTIHDVHEGLCVWYYRDGTKSEEREYQEGKLNGLWQMWYPGGKLRHSSQWKSGELEGVVTDNYSSGSLFRTYSVKDGSILGKFYTECDKKGKCRKIYKTYFRVNDNIKNWTFYNPGHRSSMTQLPGGGVSLELNSSNSIVLTTDLEIAENIDYTIESVLSFSTSKQSAGLIWGFKDWDNYYYFMVSNTGYYSYGRMFEGVKTDYKNWTRSSYINKGSSRNLLKVLKLGEYTHFAINGNQITWKTRGWESGVNFGFKTGLGEGTVTFENLTVQQLAKSVTNSNIVIGEKSGLVLKGTGTGFFVTISGLITTNYHVVDGATSIGVSVLVGNEYREFKARVFKTDPINDLALLKIDDVAWPGLRDIPYSLYSDVSELGEEVFTLGFPKTQVLGRELKYSNGSISSTSGYVGDIRHYQISVPIHGGNSGGPLFDKRGNLIGITNAGLNKNEFENVNYAIKSSYLKTLIQTLSNEIVIPSSHVIANSTRTNQIKTLRNIVVLVKVY